MLELVKQPQTFKRGSTGSIPVILSAYAALGALGVTLFFQMLVG